MADRYPWYLSFYENEGERDFYEDVVDEDRTARGRDRRFRGVDYDKDGTRYTGGGYRHSPGWIGGQGVVEPDVGPEGAFDERDAYRGRLHSPDNREYGEPRGRTIDRLKAWMQEGPHTGRGPEGYQRPNERILEDAHERLTRHGGLDAGKIEVSVENGEITLEGTVDSRRAKRMAEDALETVPGVRDIHNRLRIS